jgi:hypothetical protein
MRKGPIVARGSLSGPAMRKLIALAFACSAGCTASLDPGPMPPAPSPAPTGGDDAGPGPVLPSPDLALPGDASCGGMQFALTRVPPNVLLVLDRSGSMGDSIGGGSTTSKWTDLKTALQSVVTNYDSQTRLGVSLFSSDGNCGAGNITLTAAMNGTNVLNQVNASAPAGNTPTAATLAKVNTSGMLNDPTRENVVVLATDGLPNCGDTDVAGKITALYNATPSVKTYVIGVGDGTASDPTALDSWAVAGHTARVGAATQYYQANSPQDLKDAFDTIVGGVVSCKFALGSQPPDAMQLYVWENGVQVPVDPANGYTYDASGPSVTLNGSACAQLKANPNDKVQVVYGCPAPPPIN